MLVAVAAGSSSGMVTNRIQLKNKIGRHQLAVIIPQLARFRDQAMEEVVGRMPKVLI